MRLNHTIFAELFLMFIVKWEQGFWKLFIRSAWKRNSSEEKFRISPNRFYASNTKNENSNRRIDRILSVMIRSSWKLRQ